LVGTRLAISRPRGQTMQRLTSAQLFGAPKSARKTKARLARAKLLIVAARKRAVMTAQRYAAQPLTIRRMRRRKKPRFRPKVGLKVQETFAFEHPDGSHGG
jgi:hypothetical protein